MAWVLIDFMLLGMGHYRKTNRTRRPSVVAGRRIKPRHNKQGFAMHERLDRQMFEAIDREKDKYFRQ
jgi:hypothetical protein